VLVVVVFVVVVFVVVPVLVVVFLRCRSGRDRGLEGRDQRRAKPTAAIRLMKAWRAFVDRGNRLPARHSSAPALSYLDGGG